MKIVRTLTIVVILLSMLNLSSALEEGKDYQCVDKTSTKSPPPKPLAKIDDSAQKVPLCSEGKVPRAIIKDSVDSSPESVNISTNITTQTSEREVAYCDATYCTNFATSRQLVDNIGAEVYFTQHSPEIDSTYGIYSGVTQSLCDSNGNTWIEDCVSIGWRKNKYDVTRLINNYMYNGYGGGSGYNNFVQTSNYYYPDMPLSSTSYGVQYIIEYENGDWWLGYNGEWLGYYPGSIWGYDFTQGDLIVDQGSVRTTRPVTTTDMGNGLWASNPYSARMDSQRYKNPYSYYWYDMYTEKYTTDSNLYTAYPTSSNSMRYGGPGSTGSTITVTSPNGGENWQRGTTKTIKWSWAGNPGNVRIELLKGGTVNNVISWNAPNTGSYNWYVPSSQATGNDYKIRVKSVSNENIRDDSNGNFVISAYSSSSITVISPNGGENWQRGTTKLITWAYSGSPGSNVRIELYKAGVLKSTITSYTANDGSHGWYIPWTLPIGSDYKIKIKSTSTTYYDWSNNNFKVS